MDKAFDKVANSMKALTADMECLRNAMHSEQDAILCNRKKLLEEMARFQEERQRISQVINESYPVC